MVLRAVLEAAVIALSAGKSDAAFTVFVVAKADVDVAALPNHCQAVLFADASRLAL